MFISINKYKSLGKGEEVRGLIIRDKRKRGLDQKSLSGKHQRACLERKCHKNLELEQGQPPLHSAEHLTAVGRFHLFLFLPLLLLP